MGTLQFRILYREFLFRMVDLELLSTHALGDVSKLLGQFAALLLFLSVGLALFGFGVADSRMPPELELIAAWSGEHFLIATTMLVTGLFAVLSWEATFPGRRDVLVLAPLPVRTKTIFLAKVAAVSTALSLGVLMLHLLAGLIWPIALNKDAPAEAAPALTYDSALQPVEVPALEVILNQDLAPSTQIGPLAAGTGTGVSIGVWKRGQRRVITYGAAKANSIFEIGSISKTFTGLILAQLVKQGKVSLREPVRELLLAETVTKPAGREITLLDLATHHSGLPTMPSNLDQSGEPNPGANYHASDLYTFLARHGIARPAHAGFSYSNLGFGLLGQALAERAGRTYADLLSKEVTGPLGMTDTAVSLSPAQLARVIQGYNLRHHPIAPWDLDALAPAGAIRSTAGDMLTYLVANLHPDRIPNAGTLPAALVASHELQANVMPGMRIGLGWIYNLDARTYWHNGAIGGYSSHAFFDPECDCAAIVLLNNAPGAFDFADVLGEHIHERLTGKPAISLAAVMVPAGGGALHLPRVFVSYWLTMLLAGAFVFCSVLGVQGLAAQLLPRGQFLRVSSFLQLGAFCALVSVYFLEPVLASPGAIAITQSHALEWSPSYWFLGLLQELNGSPALAPLAKRAIIGLIAAGSTTGLAYLLSYLRTFRRIAEEPDILPASNRAGWLPRFGNAFQTAIGQFSVRTLLRSRQHRLLLAFYLGVAFAMLIFYTKAPVTKDLSEELEGTWAPVSVALLGSSVLMMALLVAGMRVVFSLPMDLRANWIFRLMPLHRGIGCLAARRRTLFALSVIPVWFGWAVVLVLIWPWQAIIGHLLVLGLVGAVLGELCLAGAQKIPFTCSYLPGKSNFHMTFLLCTGLIFVLTAKAAQLERQALEYLASLAILIMVLSALLICVRWQTRAAAQHAENELRFEDETAPAIFALDLHRDGVTPILSPPK